MRKKLILLIIIIVIIGFVAFLLFNYNKKSDEVGSFLINLKETTGFSFGEVQDIEFNWFDNNNQIIVKGRGIEIKDLAYDQYEKVDEFFYQQGFELDDFNLVRNTLYAMKGFKKDNMVCILETLDSENKFNINCGFLNNSNLSLPLEEKIKDLFFNKYGDPDLEIIIIEQLDNYAKGEIIFGDDSTEIFLVAKRNDSWQIAYDGDEAIPCEQVEEYNFPEGFVQDCSSTQTIEVKQGEKFSISLRIMTLTNYAWLLGYLEEEYIGFSPEDISIISPESDDAKDLEENLKFTALKKGETKLKFFYTCCSVEKVPLEEKTYKIIIK
jgi:predicted secreted protein